MKTILQFSFLGMMLLAGTAMGQSSCDVVKIYEAVTPERDVLALDDYGKVRQVSKLLVPAELEPGEYRLQVSKTGDNLYHARQTDYYIKTQYCYEYASYTKAVLVVEDTYNSAFSNNKLIFE